MSKYYVIKLYYPSYPKNQTYGYLNKRRLMRCKKIRA